MHKIENGVEIELTPEEEAELIAEWEANKIANAPTYAQKRALAYPSFADQFDILYHQGFDAWKKTIQAIKNEHPKL